MTAAKTGARKADHLRIVLEEDVSFTNITTGLERYHFVHCALPEIDLNDVTTETTFLGRRLAFPMMIGSMTGGSVDGGQLNVILAKAAQAAGIAMALGSTRILLEESKAKGSFDVRHIAPDILLIANLGAVQLNYGYDAEDCRRLLDYTQADALYLHLNPLQEAVQPEGDTRFAALLPHIAAVCRALDAPVIVKEVGWGLSGHVARQLVDAGVAALDVAGAGGTSWSQVEMHRHTDPVARQVAAGFRSWGIPTAASIQMIREAIPEIPLVASGGLRSGIDIAKCITLGASIASMAAPLLRAAATSSEALHQYLAVLQQQLRVAMFITGCRDIAALRSADIIHT